MVSILSFPGIMLLVSALILLANALPEVPVVGDTLGDIGSWLSGFGVLVGILDLIALVIA